MVNKSKILSDISKMAVDAMGTFSGLKKEVETGKHGTQKYVLKQGPNKGKTI